MARRFALAAVAAMLAACAVLPRHIDRPPSTAILDTGGTTLGRLVAEAAGAHPSESGVLLFNRGGDSIEARLALVELAQSSIDAQYYQWASDPLGRVLLERVLAAADRGVRVRLIIDDYEARGQDVGFAALDAHPNVEVRVFNPFVRGRLRLPQLVGRFTELNHRMHNKMLLVDGKVAVIGGRNLAADYFGMGREVDFRDFDLLAMGEVVPRAEAAFDRYWSCQWAYPISALRKTVTTAELARRRVRFARRVAADRAGFPYALPDGAAAALQLLERFRGQAIWAPVEVVWDDPSLMAERLHARPTAVGRALATLMTQAQHEIVGENAYLVPHADLPLLRATLKRGVHVALLTNSLASTDVVAVNAHYAKSRAEMAELGVRLYEMKPWAATRRLYIARSETSKAHLALHGKAAVFDREIVFLGSFNFDPRSMFLDTEAVLIVHSPALAAQLLDAFAADFQPDSAWHIGHVVGTHDTAWLSEWNGRSDVERHDPASLWRRIKRSFAGVLPLKPYL